MGKGRHFVLGFFSKKWPRLRFFKRNIDLIYSTCVGIGCLWAPILTFKVIMSILRPLYWIGSSVIGIAALQIDFCVLLGGARTDHVMAIREEYS